MTPEEKQQRSWQAELAGKRERTEVLAALIGDISRTIADLEVHIAAVEVEAGISDAAHPAYPQAARAFRERRRKVEASLAMLTSELEQAERDLGETTERIRRQMRASSDATLAGNWIVA